MILQLDHTQETITESREAIGDEAGKLAFVAMAEDPAVDPVGGEKDEDGGAADQDGKADDAWSGPDAVESEDEEIGKEESKNAGEGSFGDLDLPQLASKAGELDLEAFRQWGLTRSWGEGSSEDIVNSVLEQVPTPSVDCCRGAVVIPVGISLLSPSLKRHKGQNLVGNSL